MNVDECLEKGLLKESIKSKEKSLKSIETAKHKLSIAVKTFEAEIFEDSVINAYAVMFHASRALLFKDGFTEKSHYGLYVYVKEKYSLKIEPRFINEFNALRLERHELIYGLERPEVKKEEAQDIISIAREFIKAIEKLI